MRISQMPGCCGIAVISNLGVDNCYDDLKQAEADCLGYGYTIALATTNHKQPVASETLEARGWEKLYDFRSRTTFNDIAIWRKHLTRSSVE